MASLDDLLDAFNEALAAHRVGGSYDNCPDADWMVWIEDGKIAIYCGDADVLVVFKDLVEKQGYYADDLGDSIRVSVGGNYNQLSL